MKFTTLNHKKSRGFTLIELMIGIGIIAVAIIAILGRTSLTRGASEVKTEADSIQSIIQASKIAVGGQANMVGLTNAVVLAANGFPSQMVSGTVVTHTWNCGVTVTSQTVPAANNAKGQIDYASTPTAKCIGLINAVSGAIDSIYVGSLIVKAPNAALTTPALIQAACATNAGLPTISIIFAR